MNVADAMRAGDGPCLYYFHDPMCSWCYAFTPVWTWMRKRLADDVAIRHVAGGLAPDDDAPMAPDLRRTIQSHWRRIQQVVPGTEFNFDFWSRCTPRRATYDACRAVLAAREQDPATEATMIERIQVAYYREARNPSERETLCELAADINLDVARFRAWMDSDACRQLLRTHIDFGYRLGVRGFPSLVLDHGGEFLHVQHDYNEGAETVDRIARLLGIGGS